MRYAFNTVLNHAESAHCKDLHHIPKHRHADGELCPAEYHLARQAYLIREFFKTNSQDQSSLSD
jgi:hypothetical protein